MATSEIGVEQEDGRWNESSGAYLGDDASPERASGSEMDEQRKQQMAYQYLCHLEEAKVWMEACLKEELPATTELEEAFRNGVFLAKLGNFFSPETVPLRKIFDKEFKVLNSRGLHFRHTDNINYFMNSCAKVGLPKVFFPETTDIYDRKNMPKLIYCIHALSLFLFKLGLAPQIQDLYGKAKFTDEQISAMRKELEKYGIQMPAFSKIGGILESEMPVDEAALHAAVIAINDAVEHQVASSTLEALRNPSAHLVEVTSDHAEDYQSALYQAKNTKAAQALAKSPSKEGMDVYDTLLTQAEIQGNISQVNDVIRRKKAEEALNQAVKEINEALNNNREEALTLALSNRAARLSGVVGENGSWYMKMLEEKRKIKQEQTGLSEVGLTQADIQEAVNSANDLAEQRRQIEDIVHCINKSLDMGTVEETHTLIQKREGLFPKVLTRSAFLYHDGLYKAKQQVLQEREECQLSHQAICEQLSVLTAIAAINEAIENENSTQLTEKMNSRSAGLTSVDESYCNRYLSHLISVKEEKAQDCGVGKDDLTQIELQICVDFVNTVVQEEHDLISAIAVINETIDKGDPQNTLQALQADAAKLSSITRENSQLYQKLLLSQKTVKAQKADEDSAELWHGEIQRTLDNANRHSDEARHLAEGVTAINQAIDAQDERLLMAALTYPRASIYGVTPKCIQEYLEELKKLKDSKIEEGSTSVWLEQKTSQGHFLYFYNTESNESCWNKPESMTSNSAVLTREEIQGVISRVTAQYDRWVHMQSNEPLIVKLQANWKGYLARKAYNERRTFIKEHLPAIIKIQAFVRGFMQRLMYQRRLKELNSHPEEVVKIQSWVRMSLARKKYLERSKYFKDHNSAIVKIQAWVRANVAQNDYRKLISMQDPPVKTVRKFLHLLEHSDADFEEELDLQKLRAQVVTEIRSNQQLENDLSLMDIKIGLLVRNRITLQDVIHHGKNLKREKQDMSTALQRTKGIKSLSKESHEKLEAYQNLFYLLQTNPVYLAKLIFAMPQSKFTKFMESVILTLYNYASNAREEYLLVKLFDTALKEEINSKVDQIQEIVTGNPAVIRMVVHFNRGNRGQSSLRELLQPLVEGVLNDKNLSINTNPLEVYKAWINQMESETGEASKLPYDVEPEQALNHPEVRARIEAAMKRLTTATDTFLNSIVQSGDKIPYGMRYVAMSLRVALAEKFPEIPEAEILKVVGNLIYYRYMNPAIVAPDAFDIVSFGVDKGLTPDQRRNLGSIAKILQYAASNKMFGGESAHLSPLNGYIAEAHQRFKRFFLEVATVEEPEGHFNIDEYTDVVMVTKPVIYISVQEICDTHTLLLDHKDEIAPDANDPLHELLDDLGDAPCVEALLGETAPVDGEDPTRSSKTEISLTLTNKFEVPEDDDSDMRALFVRTKRMIVDVLNVQAGENLTEILETPASDEQEEEHMRLMKLRELNEENKSKSHGNVTRSTSAYGDNKLPLEGLKRKIIRNLRMLESQGVVTIKNDYQDIINAIAKDIRNQRRYRQRRRQEKKKLGQTLESLQSKSQFYEEQIDYYNQYIRVCLDNLSKKGKKPRAKQHKGQKGKDDVCLGEIKYTAQRLYEKGVILEIEGLPPSQFKNVMFDIKSGDEVGVFEVSAKFMGVAMEKVELVFQDLLQLQYEGVAVMKMFGRAKINVNLLIFLLNKKFYGK